MLSSRSFTLVQTGISLNDLKLLTNICLNSCNMCMCVHVSMFVNTSTACVHLYVCGMAEIGYTRGGSF